MNEARLTRRQTQLWSPAYLIHRCMWKNIERAVATARAAISGATPVVLDVGCGNKPYADLFTGCRYLGMDRSAVNADPDIIGEAADIPVQSGTVDIVFSTQVIEHVPDPQAMMRECRRVLRPGGFLILTGPFYWPLHEEPYDYYRFTKYGFEHLLRSSGFSSWEIRPDGGDWTQIFLSINLKFRRLCFAPLIVFFNCAGLVMEHLDPREQSPANYTILAKL
jgi:SAM-dependent methyltransferase